MKHRLLLLLVTHLGLFPVAAASARTEACPRGIAVESVQPRTSAEDAGVLAGDRLTSWSPHSGRERADGPATCIGTYFDWVALAEERFPASALLLSGSRESRQLTVTLPRDVRGVVARPELTPAESEIFSGGLRCERAGDAWAAASEWGALLGDPAFGADAARRLWLRMRLAETLARAGAWDASAAHWSTAEGEALQAGIPLARALAAEGLARALDGMKRPDLALVEQERALRQREGAFGDSLGLGNCLNTMGSLLRKRGDLWSARACHERALALRSRLAPGSLQVAGSTLNLAIVLQLLGNLDRAEEMTFLALALIRERAPGTVDEYYAWVNLGSLYIYRGDLAEAERCNRRALEVARAWNPESLNEAAALNNLAIVLDERGNFAEAEEMYRSSLAIRKRLSPASLDEAQSLKNIGQLAAQRWDLDRARDYMEEALALQERLAPESLQVADTLTDLGQIASDQGREDEAEAFYRRALALKEKLAPEGPHTANALSHLGAIALRKGNLEEAGGLFARSMVLRERLGPGSLPVAKLQLYTGDLRVRAGDLGGAGESYGKALAIARRLSPGGALEARALHSVGSVRRASGDLPGAAEAFGAALVALESQAARLGGGRSAREGFSAESADYYRDLVGVQVALGRGEDAFATTERYRAQVLLRMVAERDLDFSRDAPEELLREQRRLARDRDAVQGELEGLSPETDAGEVEARLRRLREIQEGQDSVAERIRKASPALASLQYPLPMGAGEVVAALEPGTLLLSWSVGEKESHLLALGRDGLELFTLPVTRKELSLLVRRLRKQVEDRTDPSSARLAELLLGPARRRIARATGLLLLPDGPLHLLPFAALPDPSARGRALVERCALRTAPSATLYAQSRGTGREPRETRLMGIGAPECVPGNPPPTQADSLRPPPPEFPSLPHAREELEAIGGLYVGAANLRVGADATEEAAKAVGDGPDLLHFACHGTVDPRFPLNSSLALCPSPESSGAGGNGLLQAWEIFEQMRIDAGLVTLSACDTATGKEAGGEGLVGLTRAFQYAGARCVLASLWSVSDASTARLMVRFYAHLRTGKGEGEALRLAQMEMLHPPATDAPHPDWSHPFYWAGFVLSGE